MAMWPITNSAYYPFDFPLIRGCSAIVVSYPGRYAIEVGPCGQPRRLACGQPRRLAPPTASYQKIRRELGMQVLCGFALRARSRYSGAGAGSLVDNSSDGAIPADMSEAFDRAVTAHAPPSSSYSDLTSPARMGGPKGWRCADPHPVAPNESAHLSGS
jgi:hypothetical protein